MILVPLITPIKFGPYVCETYCVSIRKRVILTKCSIEPCRGGSIIRRGTRNLRDRVENNDGDDDNLRAKDVIIVSELVSFSVCI